MLNQTNVVHLNGLGGLGFIHFVSVICKPNLSWLGNEVGANGGGPITYIHVQPNLTTPSEKKLFHTVQNWPATNL
jgi:hypothetical protein